MIKRYLDFIKESIHEDEQMALDFAERVYGDSSEYAGFSYEEIEERIVEFAISDFPCGLQNIPNPLYLYRLLVVESEDKINKRTLGKYYVGDKDMLVDYDFLSSTSIFDITDDNHKWFIVKIKTTPDNLDIEDMLGNRAEYPSEYQFTLLDDNDLDIIKIEEIEKLHW